MKNFCKVSRREFIATTTAAGACVCGLNGCNFLLPQIGDTPQIDPPTYDIAESGGKSQIIIDTRKTPDLLKEGNAVKIIDPRIKDRVIIANTGEKGFIAASILCSHNGAEVEYKHDRKLLKCVSYNRAEFATDGQVIKSPIDKALTTYPIRLQNEKLIVSNVV